MSGRTLRVLALCVAVCFMGAGLALAEDFSVMVKEKDGLGKYLTDGKGMAMYYFTKDTPDMSACAGECLQKWPVVAPVSGHVQAGLDAKAFGSMKRADGKEQATYHGYPLYYFFKDAAPGDTNGQGVNSVWYVIDPAKFPPK